MNDDGPTLSPKFTDIAICDSSKSSFSWSAMEVVHFAHFESGPHNIAAHRTREGPRLLTAHAPRTYRISTRPCLNAVRRVSRPAVLAHVDSSHAPREVS